MDPKWIQNNFKIQPKMSQTSPKFDQNRKGTYPDYPQIPKTVQKETQIDPKLT